MAILAPYVVVRSAGFPWADLVEPFEEVLDDTIDDATTTEGWEAMRATLRQALLKRLEDDRIQRAILWQNPPLFRKLLPRLQARPDEPTPGQRRRERILVRYLLRYHSRNETIGFFGPGSWAELTSSPETVVTEPADPIWNVAVESWAVEAVADALASQDELRRQVTIWPLPDVWLSGRTAVRSGTSHRLTPQEIELLTALTSPTPPGALARRLGISIDDLDRLATGLAERALIHRGFHVDTELAAWGNLYTQLVALPESTGRAWAIERWEELDAAARAAATAPTAGALDAALRTVGDRFERLTSRAPRREPGAAVERGFTVLAPIAGHSQRVTFGAGVRADLQRFADLLLPPSRWLCRRIGAVLEEALGDHLAMLRADLGTDQVPLGAVYAATHPALQAEDTLAPVLAEFWAAWKRVLTADGSVDLPGPEGAVDLEDLAVTRGCTAAGILESVFADPAPDRPAWWGSERLHSPDVLVAAAGMEALRRGDYRLVLGELHVGTVTADSQLYAELAQGRAAITANYDSVASWDRPRVLVHFPSGRDGVTALNDPMPYLGDAACRYLSLGFAHAERRLGSATVRLADCRVAPDPAGREVVIMPDGETLPLLAVLGEAVSHVAASLFSFLAPDSPAPRIQLGDRVILQRRRWVVNAGALAGQLVGDGRPDFVSVVTFLRSLGIPRWSFWRTSRESKPILLDLRNPLTVDLVLVEVGKAPADASLHFVEMLPGPQELWLPGPDGRPVTSELRLTMADPTKGR